LDVKVPFIYRNMKEKFLKENWQNIKPKFKMVCIEIPAQIIKKGIVTPIEPKNDGEN